MYRQWFVLKNSFTKIHITEYVNMSKYNNISFEPIIINYHNPQWTQILKKIAIIIWKNEVITATRNSLNKIKKCLCKFENMQSWGSFKKSLNQNLNKLIRYEMKTCLGEHAWWIILYIIHHNTYYTHRTCSAERFSDRHRFKYHY